jgi:hypothetical protein
LNTIVLTDVDFYPVIQPILEILDAILWPAIAIVVAVGTIYCIFLGVKISKADEQNSGEKTKKGNTNRSTYNFNRLKPTNSALSDISALKMKRQIHQ